MMGLLKVYFIYVLNTALSVGVSIWKGLFSTSGYIDAIFLVISIYFFAVNFSLYQLMKNEDKGTKMAKLMADHRTDWLQENA